MATAHAATPRFAAWLACAALALLACTAPRAQAGTYDVWSCSTPNGTPTSTLGWTPISTLFDDQPGDECALGGSLQAKFSALGGPVSGGLYAGWQFTAPEGITVAAARLNWAVKTRPADDENATARVAIHQGTDPGAKDALLAHCDATGDGCDEAGRKTVDVKVGAPTFGVTAGCAGPVGSSHCGMAEAARARAALRGVRLTLEDPTPPTGTVTGSAVDGLPLRGRREVRINANDKGAGVWQAEVRVGTKVVVKRRTLDLAGGRCATLPASHSFGDPQPCPKNASATLSFGTKGIPDGSQLLTVTVWDAANNPAVLRSTMVQVDNDRRIADDGTILMPALDDQPTDQLFSAAGTSGDAKLRPPTLGSEPVLRNIISAMNALADAQLPYCYGGGHGVSPAVPSAGDYCWVGKPARKVTNSGTVGLDCSSSLSWVLQQAGYDLPTITSGQFAGIGEAGEGELMTIWANADHVYVDIKLEGQTYSWGTSPENPQHGPGWHRARSSSGFVARHLPGL